jgi:hypothetical protein
LLSNIDQFARLKLPYVRATDPSGLLLAITPPLPTPPSSDDDESEGVVVTDIPRPADYLVLDVSSGTATATRVPDLRDDAIVYKWHNLGVIAAPGGAPGFMLAEFDHRVGFDEATLTCFSSQTDKWAGKDVDNPLPYCFWNFDAIISHDAKLWWVDVAAGLLACDPFADEPEMVYVPLPEPEEGEEYDDDHHHASRYDYSVYTKRKLRSRRCVQVSNGKFRCVELSRIRRTKRGAPTVIMHTLADPEAAEWTVEYVVFFDEIWDDDTYKASGLQEKAPVIALIHPENPGVLYFFVKDYLVGFDMRARKLVCQAREPTKGAVSPSDVLALVLPPALTAGSVRANCSFL